MANGTFIYFRSAAERDPEALIVSLFLGSNSNLHPSALPRSIISATQALFYHLVIEDYLLKSDIENNERRFTRAPYIMQDTLSLDIISFKKSY